jgi:putative endopeptidase
MSTIKTPGENFYLHVNKQWLEDPENAIPGDYSSWGGFAKLHDEGLLTQIQLVKDLIAQDDRSAEEMKIAAIWQASDHRFTQWSENQANMDPIYRELDSLDSILRPSEQPVDQTDLVDRIAQYLYYSKVNGIGNVFDFDKGADFENSNNVCLDLVSGGTTLPGREYYTEDSFLEKREAFKQHLENVRKLVNKDRQVLSNDFVQNVIDFENQLAALMMKEEQARKYDTFYTNTTLSDLYENVNTLRYNLEKDDNYDKLDQGFKLDDNQIVLAKQFFETVYGSFDFRAILESNHSKHFKDTDNGPNVHHITAFDGDGIRRTLALIFDPTNYMKYISFLQYKAISATNDFCSQDIDEEYFDFFSRKLTGQENQKSSDKRSIQTVSAYAGELLGKVYVKHCFPDRCKDDVRDMIDQALIQMDQSIKENDWLTEPTKLKALKKLSKFNSKIGYPDVWKDYSDLDIMMGDSLYAISTKANKWSLRVNFFEKLNSQVDKDEWMMTPNEVNAYFNPQLNEIVFPAAIIQAPFYHATADTIDYDSDEDKIIATPDFIKSANFGGIGAVIFHEITHGYDDQGRKFNESGELENWWTDADSTLFAQKTDILAEQVDRYVFKHDGIEHRMNPRLTIGENLADCGGISLALKTLTNQLVADNRDPGYIQACHRVCLKSFATIWRLNIKPDVRISKLSTDCHAPTDFRANMVNNMEEFYDAFNVQDGDPMYIPPEKRLRMW